jgi:hypothetical protein
MQVFKQSFSAVAALGIVSVVWGTTWVASRQGVLYMPALQLAGIRQLLGGFAFLAYYLPTIKFHLEQWIEHLGCCLHFLGTGCNYRVVVSDLACCDWVYPVQASTLNTDCIGHGFRTDWDLYHILHTFRRLIEF